MASQRLLSQQVNCTWIYLPRTPVGASPARHSPSVLAGRWRLVLPLAESQLSVSPFRPLQRCQWPEMGQRPCQPAQPGASNLGQVPALYWFGALAVERERPPFSQAPILYGAGALFFFPPLCIVATGRLTGPQLAERLRRQISGLCRRCGHLHCAPVAPSTPHLVAR